MGNKEFVGIIKSGLVGAFVFTGFYIILAVLSLFAELWIPWAAYPFLIIIPFPKTIFTVTCSIGFILGLVLRRRFSIIQHGILPLIIAFILAAVPLTFGVWLLNRMAGEVEMAPSELKLADCTNNVVNIHLKVPKGHAYYLALASTNGDSFSSYKFSGNVCISNETSLIANFPIHSDNSWDSSGFILTGAGDANTNSPPLSKFIEAQKDYTIRITFDPPPPTNSSIELHWWQAYKDRDK